MKFSFPGSWTVVGQCARLLPAAFAFSLVATLSAALRVLAMPLAVIVGFVCGTAPLGPCPHLACFQSFGLGSQPMMFAVLAAASEFGGFTSAGRCSGENSGLIAELNGCCSCAPEPFMVSFFRGQAADLLCSGQHCVLVTCQGTPLSRWSPRIISDGAAGLGYPSEHIAAAAPSLNFQSDLLAASAATATEYTGCQTVQQALQAAATEAAMWVGNPFVAIVFHTFEWCCVIAGTWFGWCILL